MFWNYLLGTTTKCFHNTCQGIIHSVRTYNFPTKWHFLNDPQLEKNEICSQSTSKPWHEIIIESLLRDSHSKLSYRNAVQKSFAKFRGKHHLRSLFLIMLQVYSCVTVNSSWTFSRQLFLRTALRESCIYQNHTSTLEVFVDFLCKLGSCHWKKITFTC